MDNKLSSLYRLGGLAGVLSGFLMFASSIWYIFDLASISTPLSADQLELMRRLGVFHGVGVVTIILLVPTVLAGYGLLSSEAPTRSAFGTSLAIPWLVIELIAHCSQTAPLGALAELVGEPATAAIGTSVYALWTEWSEALFMTGAFLCVLLALCYGSAIHTWGNSVAASLFFISIIAFPVGIFLNLDVQLHVLIRGLAFLFLGGVLIQAPQAEE